MTEQETPSTDELTDRIDIAIARIRLGFSHRRIPADLTDVDIVLSDAKVRIDTDRENMGALQEAHDHAQDGLRNARRQETEMREKIAALEAEVIKSAERIEEYRAELRERDDMLCGAGADMATLRALNAEMLEALRELVNTFGIYPNAHALNRAKAIIDKAHRIIDKAHRDG